jgi:hypothetical protein
MVKDGQAQFYCVHVWGLYHEGTKLVFSCNDFQHAEELVAQLAKANVNVLPLRTLDI